MPIKYSMFAREATVDCPNGVTVSKHSTLPTGDFGITEYTFERFSLWFVDADDFDANERQEAYEGACRLADGQFGDNS